MGARLDGDAGGRNVDTVASQRWGDPIPAEWITNAMLLYRSVRLAGRRVENLSRDVETHQLVVIREDAHAAVPGEVAFLNHRAGERRLDAAIEHAAEVRRLAADEAGRRRHRDRLQHVTRSF